MIKYCKILDEKTGLVQLGAGCTDEYYEEIGMEKLNVRQSDVDFQYYLYDMAPMKTEEQKKKEEEQRIAKLNMTKQDFYNVVLKPNGVTFDKLTQILASNEEYKIAWELCERVYRGDTKLIGALKKYLPNLTDDDITNYFETIGE